MLETTRNMFSREEPFIPRQQTNPPLRQPLSAFPVRQQACPQPIISQQTTTPPPQQPSLYAPLNLHTQQLSSSDIEPDIEHLLDNTETAIINSVSQECGIVSFEIAAFESDTKKPLPDGFEWEIIELDNTENLCKLRAFVNDFGNLPGQPKQRPDYSLAYLNWLRPEVLLTIVSAKKRQIVGSIGLFPICYVLDDFCVDSYFTGLFVVHPRLRNKGMETVLLQEVIRLAKVKMNGLMVSKLCPVSTIGNKLKMENLYPLSRAGFRWMCRPLNMDKLAQTLMKTKAGPREIEMLNQTYQIRPTKHIELFRRLSPEHVPFVFVRYQEDCQEKHIRMRRVMNISEFEELYLPHDHLYSYVLQNGRGEIKDFISFYILRGANGFKYAYLAYITYPNDTILSILLRNTLYIAKRLDIDFFFVQDMGATMSGVLNALKFKDSGNRTFYDLFNYRSKSQLIPPQCAISLPV